MPLKKIKRTIKREIRKVTVPFGEKARKYIKEVIKRNKMSTSR